MHHINCKHPVISPFLSYVIWSYLAFRHHHLLLPPSPSEHAQALSLKHYTLPHTIPFFYLISSPLLFFFQVLLGRWSVIPSMFWRREWWLPKVRTYAVVRTHIFLMNMSKHVLACVPTLVSTHVLQCLLTSALICNYRHIHGDICKSIFYAHSNALIVFFYFILFFLFRIGATLHGRGGQQPLQSPR